MPQRLTFARINALSEDLGGMNTGRGMNARRGTDERKNSIVILAANYASFFFNLLEKSSVTRLWCNANIGQGSE